METYTFARHPQSHQGVCADAIATIEGFSREELDHAGFISQQRAAKAIEEGAFERLLVPVYNEDGSVALDKEEYPRRTTAEGSANLKPAFGVMKDAELDESGMTYRKLINDKYPATWTFSFSIMQEIHRALLMVRRRCYSHLQDYSQ